MNRMRQAYHETVPGRPIEYINGSGFRRAFVLYGLDFLGGTVRRDQDEIMPQNLAIYGGRISVKTVSKHFLQWKIGYLGL